MEYTKKCVVDSTELEKRPIGRLIRLKDEIYEQAIIGRKFAVLLHNELEKINSSDLAENDLNKESEEPRSILDELDVILNQLRETNNLMKHNIEHIETII